MSTSEITHLHATEDSEPLMTLEYVCKAFIKYKASDLHLKAGRPPLYRIDGRLIPSKMKELDQSSIERLLKEVLTKEQIQVLKKKRNVDFSIRFEKLGRFRFNVFFQKSMLSAVIRRVPFEIPRLETLGVPLVLKKLAFEKRGLLLITGPTGSGKSTTLASLVQYINRKKYSHVLTLEDPIEFEYVDLKSTITQREIGTDALDYHSALMAGLRQDPDVIVMGELREPEVIRIALTAAETGHLVIATLHTNDVMSSLDRIMDVFPGGEKEQVRLQLASTLVGIVSQQLIEKKDKKGRVLASEVLVQSSTIENLMAKGAMDQIPEVMRESFDYHGMQTMNKDLKRLVLENQISEKIAIKHSYQPDDLKLSLSHFGDDIDL
ncbi:MAG: type IV pili twitching motility protein PilT [Bdellovibrionaceae bacterium]|nr:type IV pili twitching motility protein PilT [Pseudobdellovibrionaceae bacterium]